MRINYSGATPTCPIDGNEVRAAPAQLHGVTRTPDVTAERVLLCRGRGHIGRTVAVTVVEEEVLLVLSLTVLGAESDAHVRGAGQAGGQGGWLVVASDVTCGELVARIIK